MCIFLTQVFWVSDGYREVNLNSYAKFSVMRDALNATGKPMFFSFEPHLTWPISWPSTVGNAWRTGDDIRPVYTSLLQELDLVNNWVHALGPGALGDADILEVGNAGLSLPEQRTHFVMWCLIKSPLLLGCDLSRISNDTLALIKNAELIAVNQDVLVVPAQRVAAYDLDSSGKFVGRQSRTWQQDNKTYVPPQSEFAGITPCQYGSAITVAQQWVIANGSRLLRGTECLGRKSGLVALAPCTFTSSTEEWDLGTSSHHVALTLTQIKAPDSGRCLAFNGQQLVLQACHSEPTDCNLKRCANSVLVTELWYLSSMTGQLISSFTNTSVPPILHDQLSEVLVQECNASSSSQQWTMTAGHQLVSTLDKRCLATSGMTSCSMAAQWQLRAAPSLSLSPLADPAVCLDLYNYTGPTVQLFRCKVFNNDTRGSQNEQWVLEADSGLLRSSVTETCCGTPSRPVPGPLCLANAPSPSPPPPSPINVPVCLASEPSAIPPAPKPPAPIPTGTVQVWAGPLNDGSLVVAVLNSADSVVLNVTVPWSDLGLHPAAIRVARDLLAHADLGARSGSITALVGPHDVMVVKLSPPSD